MARREDPLNREKEESSPRLDRRRFLSRSALVSGALITAPAALAPGCGASMSGASMASSESRELLDRLERGLGRVRGVPRGDIARRLTWVARPDISETVMRQTLEALVVADVARSLPDGASVPSPLAGRLVAELPVLGRSADTHHAMLARMPRAARRELDALFEQEPELPMAVAGWIDRHAAELGTLPDSRLKLRMAARDIKVRLRRQSANAVIDECVAKVERAMARSGSSLALARSAAVPAMIDAIWQQVDAVPTGSGSGSSLTAPTLVPPAGYGVPAPQPSADEDREWAQFMNESDRFWSARWRRPGDEELIIGPSLMPFGLVSCGLMLIIGLIVLIAGAVQNAEWDGRPRDPR